MCTVRRAIAAGAAALPALLLGASAAPAATGRAYVLKRSPNAVAVVDVATRTLVRSIPLAADGKEIVVSSDGTRAYVAHTGGDAVSVIETASDPELKAGAGGQTPEGLSISPDGKRLYVAPRNGIGITV